MRVRPRNGPTVNCEGVVKMRAEWWGFEERGFEQPMVHGVNGIAQTLPKLGRRIANTTTAMSQQKKGTRGGNDICISRVVNSSGKCYPRLAPPIVEVEDKN